MANRLNLYLNKHAIEDCLIEDAPNNRLELIITIPAINEPAILETLQSLQSCAEPKLPAEVIVFINNSTEASPEVVQQNKKSFTEVQQWIKEHSTSHLSFHCIYIDNLPPKDAGAGLARKIVMDEAVRRFASINNEQGIIAALDADALVSPNYLVEIQHVFAKQPKLNATHFYFEHPIGDANSNDPVEPIVLYELYLRYYKQALAATGFPLAFYTVGSSFAVRATAYAKQGGMNKKQAGEDFYFLNKIYQLGNCIELNQVAVYPSSRSSDRVPFGTGAAINKIMVDRQWLTYQPMYFTQLKHLFQGISNLYSADVAAINKVFGALHPTLQEFITRAEFQRQIAEIKNNTASESQFVQRFFRWFDAFKIIKYLNNVHTTVAPKVPIEIVAYDFLIDELKFETAPKNACELLLVYRQLEKK